MNVIFGFNLNPHLFLRLFLTLGKTKLMKQLDYGKGYRYAHDEDEGFAAGENYLPQGMPAPDFYQPVPRGLELKIAEKMASLRQRNQDLGSQRQVPQGKGPAPQN